jgi:type IV pilus assembly protein PilE
MDQPKHHRDLSRFRGYTLVELMITVAVLTILAGIAVPLYSGYIREGHLTTMRSSMAGLRTILEDYRLENGDYGPGAVGLDNINTTYEWEPGGDLGAYSFTVAVAGGTYNVWATLNSNSSVWVRCDARFTNCCDPDTPSATAATSACP